jgi:hypothetical protein
MLNTYNNERTALPSCRPITSNVIHPIYLLVVFCWQTLCHALMVLPLKTRRFNEYFECRQILTTLNLQNEKKFRTILFPILILGARFGINFPVSPDRMPRGLDNGNHQISRSDIMPKPRKAQISLDAAPPLTTTVFHVVSDELFSVEKTPLRVKALNTAADGYTTNCLNWLMFSLLI